MITREEIELAENIGALSFEQGANMRSLVAEVERLRAHAERKCQWTMEDDGDEVWETGCNEALVFDEGNPRDYVKFCAYCGGAVEFVEDGEK